MKCYLVEYAVNDYSGDRRSVRIIASSAVRAAECVSKRRYTGYSGRVVSVVETFDSVVIAK